MRYSSIRSMDISNGEGIGVSLFVSGCPFHCYNCFNSETWSFSSGKEWTEEIEKTFLTLINRPYIKRVSFLGGSPLAEGNREEVFRLCEKIKTNFPSIIIWVYTGFTWEELTADQHIIEGLQNVDVLVDGRYDDSLKDLSLPFRGSTNQRIIDVQQSLKSGEPVLWSSSK